MFSVTFFEKFPSNKGLFGTDYPSVGHETLNQLNLFNEYAGQQ